jgi:cytochrome c556
MRKSLLIAVATVSLLGACRQAEEAPNAAAENETAAANATANAAVPAGANPLGAAVSGDQAKKVMHDRHEGMEEIGDAMKLVTNQLKSGSPDLAKVRDGAATIARLAPEVSGWYPPGTGPDVGKTRAKAEIWQKPQDFAAKAKAFPQAAQAFNTAAQGADVAAIRAAQGELGKACKACHDPYRAEEKGHAD